MNIGFNSRPARASLLCLLLSAGACFGAQPSSKTLWTIGRPDHSANEFALAPDGYAQFLDKDFGWEDRFFLIGRSNPKDDWPYVLPGPSDSWAGSGGLAGDRTQVLNILFDLADCPTNTSWKLTIDLLDTHATNPPILKVTVNDKPWTFQLQPGAGDITINGEGKEQQVTMILEPGLVRPGGNQISLVGLQGSWSLFDSIRLEGPEAARLAPNAPLFIRETQPTDYEIEIDDRHWQPLLVDLECLETKAELVVLLDGEPIFKTVPEPGRSILEVPLPAVDTTTESVCELVVNGRTAQTVTVSRQPHPLIGVADYVDPMMGVAHSRWMIAPGPWMPFSMVKLSPDNQNAGWQAGYDPHIESIGGFSHIHEWTMAGLLMMPATGPLVVQVGDQYDPDAGYRSRIDKTKEEAKIGYYRAYLSDYDIEAELTATTRASFQRYTFNKAKAGRVLIDLQIPAEYRFNLEEIEIRKVNDHRIEGFAQQHAVGVWGNDAQQEYPLYFVVEFDQPMTRFGAWTDAGIQPEVRSLQTGPVDDAGVFAEFNTKANPVVQVRTGISLVSIDNAGLNLTKEISQPFGWDFEAVRNHQRDVWNALLGRIQIETLDRREKVRFYSNLYRSFCRNTWSDVDGRWRDPAERIRQLTNPDDVMLGCDAFWNTFWNLNQVWNLVAPEWSSRWVRSQLAMYDASGWLAKGPAGLEYIPVMVAEHEIPLMVGAYQMGIRDFDAEKALEAMVKMQRTPARAVEGGLAGNRDLVTYLKHQYVPADEGRTSNSLEYAFDDWAVAQFAKALGKTDLYREFLERSTWWRNIFDAEMGYARMRNTDGQWVTPFDPYRSGANKQYVEGNAWQLTFFVPQDVPGLIDALGRDRFLERLDQGFTRSAETRFNAPNEQYWDYPVVHGNQQSMHFAFLFNWADKPWLTQKWSREVLDRYYGYGTGDAYLGDEDQGQMSAWFVMAALGLFQMDGGCRVDPIYEIGSPLYPRVRIDLGKRFGRGEEFIITAKNTSRRNKYVQSAHLNGRPLNQWWFPSSELLKGGELQLEMGAKPNHEWLGPSPKK